MHSHNIHFKPVKRIHLAYVKERNLKTTEILEFSFSLSKKDCDLKKPRGSRSTGGHSLWFELMVKVCVCMTKSCFTESGGNQLSGKVLPIFGTNK